MEIQYFLTREGELRIVKNEQMNQLVDSLLESSIDLEFKVNSFEEIMPADQKGSSYTDSYNENNTIGIYLSKEVKDGLVMLQTVSRPSRTAILDHFVELHLKDVLAKLERDGLKKELDKITETSYRDPLTGLFNMRGYFEIGDKMVDYHLRKLKPFSLLFLDVNEFKQFNETDYGHSLGDRVLSDISAILSGHGTATAVPARKILRDADASFRFESNKSNDYLTDHFLGDHSSAAEISGNGTANRYGGDEFAVTLPGANAMNAMIAAQRVLDSIRNHTIMYADQKYNTSISIGIATLGEDGITFLELHKKADERLMHGKNNLGKGHYYSPHHAIQRYQVK